MKKIRTTAILAATVMALGFGMAETASDPVSVDAFPLRDSMHWMTVRTPAVPLQWDWQANAVSARLTIVGMNSSIVKDFASVTTNWVWQAAPSEVPSAEDEDVYTLTLAFYDGGGIIVGELTSRLAVVTGAFGQTPVDPSLTETPAWRRVKGNVVIPYQARWDAASATATNSLLGIARADGMTQTNALLNTSGYFGWQVKNNNWGYGTFDLTLTFPGTVASGWEATLFRMPTATVFNIR